MIDMHVHILPGLDDGPRDLEEALDMARCAVSDGIRAVAATPHVIPGIYDNGKKRILREAEEFKKELKKRGIPLEVYPAAEYMLDPELPRWLQEGQALTYNDGGRYLLVEFPSAGIPPYAERILYDIALQGITPVIAHPERNAELNRFPDRLLHYVERGALAQITAGSLLGRFGRKAQQAARYYMEVGACHIMGSDGHAAHHRTPVMSGAARWMAVTYGDRAGRLLTSVNPGCILNGERVKSSGSGEGPALVRRGGFFGRVLKNLKYLFN